MTQVDRRKTDAYRNLGVDILRILDESGSREISIRRTVAAIKASTGVDAIGMRLCKGDDFPYTQQEFIGKADLLEDIILPEDRHIWQEHQKDSLIRHMPGEVQFRIVGKDGAVRWIEHVCQPVKADTGRFLGVRGSNRDITDRKQSEKALREREAELRESRDYNRNLTNSLPDVVYSVSMPERTIEWGNDALTAISMSVRYQNP